MTKVFAGGQAIAGINFCGIAGGLGLNPAIHFIQRHERADVAIDEKIRRQPPRHATSVVTKITVVAAFQIMPGGGCGRCVESHGKIRKQPGLGTEARLDLGDNAITFIGDARPVRVFGGVLKRVKVIHHEIGRPRSVVKFFVVGGGPVAKAHRPNFTIDFPAHYRRDGFFRLDQIVDLSVAAPLPVGKQQRIGNVQIAVRGGIIAIGSGGAIGRNLLPSHQTGRKPAGMICVKTEKSVEINPGRRVMTRHQRRDDHAVTVTFGN